MRLRAICFVVGMVCLGQPQAAHAQQIDVDISATRAMYNVLSALEAGRPKDDVGAVLDSVLQTRPYRTMFAHYNRSWRPNHLPPAVFKRMILSVQFPAEYTKGENTRADQMLPLWQRTYAGLPAFEANVRALERMDVAKLAREALRETKEWLPRGWSVPDYYLPIIPSGGSTAFAIDGAQGYDFFQLPRDSSGAVRWDEVSHTIAHESHHLAVAAHTAAPGPMSSRDSVAYEFLTIFMGEGTATKFINGFPGGCVPTVNPARHDPLFTGATREMWERYTAEETELFRHFERTLDGAISGSISRDSLHAEIGSFWLAGFISPVYFVGSELFGAVYHGLGKKGVFAAMEDPRELPSLYNDAIKRRPDLLGSCRVLADSTVQRARAIGVRD